MFSRTKPICHVVVDARGGIQAEVPVPQEKLGTLPFELQSGQALRLVPVVFNVGINQKATLAEKSDVNKYLSRVPLLSFMYVCVLLKLHVLFRLKLQRTWYKRILLHTYICSEVARLPFEEF